MMQHQIQLKSVAFDAEGLSFKKTPSKSDLNDCPTYDVCLQEAENIVNNVRDVRFKLTLKAVEWKILLIFFLLQTSHQLFVDEPSKEFSSQLRWFVNQKEAWDLLQGCKNITPKIPPFVVTHYDAVNIEEYDSVTPDSVLDQLNVHY